VVDRVMADCCFTRELMMLCLLTVLRSVGGRDQRGLACNDVTGI